MASSPRFRLMSPAEQGPRRRGPGPAVLLVALYALLFVGALWFLRREGDFPPLFQRQRPAGGAPAAGSRRADTKADGLSRPALLEAAGLSPLSRAEYSRRLSTDCCPCGCDLNLRDCLLSDQTCARSPQLALAIFQRLR